MAKKRRGKVNFSEVRYPKRKLESKVSELMSSEELETVYAEWDNFTREFACMGFARMRVDFCNDEFREWFDSDDCKLVDKKQYLPFRQWYEKNKKILKSAAFHDYKLKQETKKKELYERFSKLDPIKYHYEVSLGYLGRWLSILERWYEDEIKTVELASAFLLEIAICEFVFLSETASVRESEEYKDWLLDDEANEVFPHMRRRGSHDWKWQALISDKDCYRGSREGAEVIISNVQGRVSSENPDENICGLIASESARFSSSDLDFEYYRSSVIASCFSNESISVSPPWLLEGIKKCLQKWDARGRDCGWDAPAIKKRDESIAFREELLSVFKEGSDARG